MVLPVNHGSFEVGGSVSERTVAEFFDTKLTGVGAMERYAQQEGRLIDIDSLRPCDGTFRFSDGVKKYKPVMFGGGWRIVVVKETE